MEFTNEQIQLVVDVDIWAQENSKYHDRQFQNLYKGENGWRDVEKDYPINFLRALALAMELQHNLEVKE
jgi:hypothetical protein